MAENYQKKELLALMATGANKLCIDCNAPSPQWASVSFGTFICLECSGVHRGFGVHISFIRSITMDKWSDDQLKKMKNGGNEAFKSFMESYGPEGGYTKGMGMSEKYNCWAAAQYRDKLAAACADPPKDWSPSSPPADFGVPSRPQSSQATRKSRAGGIGPSGLGSGSNVPSRTGSPFMGDNSGSGSRSASGSNLAGSGNEAFFERLGSTNSLRPDNLPPSQGGKYAGFGSTPEPDTSSSHPSYGLSSQSVPTLDDFQRNPLGALTKGWGLFSTAVASAGREINESVVKPGMSRAQDMYEQGASDDMKRAFNNASTQARGAAGWMGARASEGWDSVNDVARTRGGVDLNEQFGRLGLGGPSARDQGYGQVGQHGGAHDDDFFDSWDSPAQTPTSATGLRPNPPAASSSKAPAKKKDDWEDDEWKDF